MSIDIYVFSRKDYLGHSELEDRDTMNWPIHR